MDGQKKVERSARSTSVWRCEGRNLSLPPAPSVGQANAPEVWNTSHVSLMIQSLEAAPVARLEIGCWKATEGLRGPGEGKHRVLGDRMRGMGGEVG